MTSEQSLMGVERLNVEELRAPVKTPKPPPTPHPEPPSRHETQLLEVLLTSFAALGYALSARSLLLLSMIGAFVLAIFAAMAQTMATLEVLIAYSLLVVLPVVFLEFRRREG